MCPEQNKAPCEIVSWLALICDTWLLLPPPPPPKHPNSTNEPEKGQTFWIGRKWVRIDSRHIVMWMKLNSITNPYESMACKNFFCKSWPKFKKEEHRRWTTSKEQPDPRVRPEGREAEIWKFEPKQGEGVTCRTQEIYEALWFLGKDRWQKGLGISRDS